MLKRAILALSLLCLLAPTAHAQGWADSQGATGQNGPQWSNGQTDTNNFYQQVPRTNTFSPMHQSSQTNQQMTNAPLTNFGGPVIIGGYNTKWAPGSLALQTQNHSVIGGTLPKTTLDSFVAQSGYNDYIYGDEGTDGPPPYSSFGTIGSGGVHATTGHQSDAPSAWY